MPTDSREAITALFDGNHFTRMGLRDVPWPETLLKWTKQGYPITRMPYMDDYSGDCAFAEFGVKEFPIDAIEYFQMDLVKCGFYWDVYPFRGRNELISEETRTPIPWKTARALGSATTKSVVFARSISVLT